VLDPHVPDTAVVVCKVLVALWSRAVIAYPKVYCFVMALEVLRIQKPLVAACHVASIRSLFSRHVYAHEMMATKS